jgi:hypothetical protein
VDPVGQLVVLVVLRDEVRGLPVACERVVHGLEELRPWRSRFLPRHQDRSEKSMTG